MSLEVDSACNTEFNMKAIRIYLQVDLLDLKTCVLSIKRSFYPSTSSKASDRVDSS